MHEQPQFIFQYHKNVQKLQQDKFKDFQTLLYKFKNFQGL